MKLKYPIALYTGIILIIFGCLFWFAPNTTVHGDTKYIISVIQTCIGFSLISFSYESK